MKIIFIFLFIFLFVLSIGVVSAYGECRTVAGDEWCCDNDGDVFCDPVSIEVCGTSEWCQNYNNPQLSCIPGEDWCCWDSGWVADYNSERCCSPDYPFHYSLDDTCWGVRTSTSNNYYTNLAQCEYIWNPSVPQWEIEESCIGLDYSICEASQISQWIDGWDNKGKIIGQCSVECIFDSDCPSFGTCNQNFICEQCVPKTCVQLSSECGNIDDGCGNTLNCGSCGSGEICKDYICECVPKTCFELNVECGEVDDSCGNILNCESCGNGLVCDNNACKEESTPEDPTPDESPIKDEPPTPDKPTEDCLFPIGTICVKLWMVIAAVGLFVLFIFGGSRR